ncbi:hypothetical protein CAPTEDRAFT_149212 [Capitella teleta]|uniref:RING-type domain-containing protein n=1 Tax=Capitella teleta TaxID=283909 RepID=R7UJY4_CAPTE|nr:hypothetical protein CAPTEDRAFT_149212 [Capitella teleta]|eukprot:ELU04103.1 hypothetical protein CAPTEDRAFT_149212 [Capitella teleta]
MRGKNGPCERKVRLKTINPHITCSLCKGYLVEATTITECLHTFCKTCIVKYLEEHTSCPKCGELIHQSHPLNYISHDRTMQDIVFKLVPNLQQSESKRFDDFYTTRGLPIPKTHPVGLEDQKDVTKEERTQSHANDDGDCHRSDEQVNVFLECNAHHLKSLKRKYIRCSSQSTITHLKKFIALKIYNNIDRFKDVDVLCNNEILGKDHTLKFIFVTRWRAKDTPLKLNYRPRLEI